MFNTQLSVRDLSASRGGFLLFETVSFAIKPGGALRITGPNGTGKTTLLRCIAGLVCPDSGTIDKPKDNALHYLGHQNAMKPQLTVWENLNFWAGGNEAANCDPAIHRLNLTGLKDLPFSVLSSGQKRRVALARLLLSPRPIWLLDEPTVGLDNASVDLVETILQSHLGNGGIVVAATHTALGSTEWQTLDLQPVQS